MSNNKLPKVLARILRERNISQKKLSQLSGVSASSINNMLSGRQNYKTDNLIAISNALGVSLDVLLKDEVPFGVGLDSIDSTVVLDGAYRVTLSKLEIPLTTSKKVNK